MVKCTVTVTEEVTYVVDFDTEGYEESMRADGYDPDDLEHVREWLQGDPDVLADEIDSTTGSVAERVVTDVTADGINALMVLQGMPVFD